MDFIETIMRAAEDNEGEFVTSEGDDVLIILRDEAGNPVDLELLHGNDDDVSNAAIYLARHYDSYTLHPLMFVAGEVFSVERVLREYGMRVADAEG